MLNCRRPRLVATSGCALRRAQQGACSCGPLGQTGIGALVGTEGLGHAIVPLGSVSYACRVCSVFVSNVNVLPVAAHGGYPISLSWTGHNVTKLFDAPKENFPLSV